MVVAESGLSVRDKGTASATTHAGSVGVAFAEKLMATAAGSGGPVAGAGALAACIYVVVIYWNQLLHSSSVNPKVITINEGSFYTLIRPF